MGLTNTLDNVKLGSDAASSTMILEQGLALDELAQGESGTQSAPTTGAAGKDAVSLSSSVFSDGGAQEQERWYSCGSWEVQQSLKFYGGIVVVGRGSGGELPQPTAGEAG